MNTTDQLPEPELGYIKTDKSNQPAFSARQMREAMKHAMQTSAEVQGESVAWCIEAQVDGEWSVQYPIAFTKQGAELDASSYVTGTVLRIRPLAFGDTTTQPAQATQAEVTDAQILDIAAEWSNRAFADGAWRFCTDFARAILALRPERVPMTDEEIFNAYCKSDSILSTHITNLVAFAKAIEAHHDITAQAKKEDV